MTIMYALMAPLAAAPPDLTSGGVIPTTLTTTWNLGPTGMRGWMYYDTTNSGVRGTTESRQIQVREVDLGSPADGIFQPDDLILGASGTAAAPVLFNSDARRALSMAIADAEARNPAALKLIRWRGGVQSVVTLTLRTLGAYSATAPYNCPKSEEILRQGVHHYYTNESSGSSRLGVLILLAAQDDLFADRALYLQKAQTEARALIKSASSLQALRDYTASTGYPVPWQRGHELIVLGEYYLVTGDSLVLPTIEALAINIAKGTTHFGTVAHSLRLGPYDESESFRPTNTGYGVVNSVGMPCLLALQLAKRCGVNNPIVDEVISKAKMFYASYAHRGAIPYGEHEAFDARHESNGKSGLAAIVLDNDPDYESAGEFFTMMALASGDTERDMGHTGAYFNYLWSPLGVQRGGPAAVQEHFRQVSWMLDLHRRWDGGFDYDSYSENRAPNGSEYYGGFRMSLMMLLTYALPLESIHLTGRDSNGALALSPEQISQCAAAENYNATSRTLAQLVADLGVWSPKVRLEAATELSKRTVDTTTRNQIRSLALNAEGFSRYGAIRALGQMKDSEFTGQLVTMLNDSDSQVRMLAAKALRSIPNSYKTAYREAMMTTLVSRERPLFPASPEDPMQLDQAELVLAIFGSGSFANNRSEMDTLISQVGSKLFFDALKVASRQPHANARGRVTNLYKVLTPAEVNLMAPELVDVLALEAPADRMSSLGVRLEAMRAMQRNLVAEAVPAAMQAIEGSNAWSGWHVNLLDILTLYGGTSTLITPDPDIVAFAQRYLTDGTQPSAQALLDAVAADTNPSPPFYFKRIDSVRANPGGGSGLLVDHFDHAMGDSRFTWTKLSGPGELTFFPNATPEADEVRYISVGQSGDYDIEVTMADSRGFTEVKKTISLSLAAGPSPQYFNWAMGYPGLNLGDPLGDEDHDGRDNGYEWVWGLDPGNSASQNPVRNHALQNGQFTLHYSRRPPAETGMTFWVETSSNLLNGSWIADLGTPHQVLESDADGVELVRVIIPSGGAGQKARFIRIKGDDELPPAPVAAAP